MGMTGNDFQKYAMRTNDGNSTDRLKNCLEIPAYKSGDLINGVLGLTGEAGEVADMVKKSIFHEKGLNHEHLKRELGDVMWYVALICDACGFTLDDVMETNVDKLISRYPNGFDIFRANHREASDI